MGKTKRIVPEANPVAQRNPFANRQVITQKPKPRENKNPMKYLKVQKEAGGKNFQNCPKRVGSSTLKPERLRTTEGEVGSQFGATLVCLC